MMHVVLVLLLNGLRWLFFSRLGFMILTAFAWLGINFGSVNLIIQPTIDALEGFANGSQGGGGGEYFLIAQQWGGVLNFDNALTMVISAYTTRVIMLNARLFLFKRGVGAS